MKYILTEKQLDFLGKQVINEQRSMMVEQQLLDCLPNSMKKYDRQSGSYLPLPNFLLDNLSDATDSFNDGKFIDWDEGKIVKALEGSSIKDSVGVQKVLKCLLPKIGFRQLQDNNPLLTICRIAFTNSIMGSAFTDLGDQNLKTRAEKALSKLGIKTKI